MKTEIYKDKKKQWRWRIKARNGRIIGASSEAFKKKPRAERNIGLVREALGNVFVIGK